MDVLTSPAVPLSEPFANPLSDPLATPILDAPATLPTWLGTVALPDDPDLPLAVEALGPAVWFPDGLPRAVALAAETGPERPVKRRVVILTVRDPVAAGLPAFDPSDDQDLADRARHEFHGVGEQLLVEAARAWEDLLRPAAYRIHAAGPPRPRTEGAPGHVRVVLVRTRGADPDGPADGRAATWAVADEESLAPRAPGLAAPEPILTRWEGFPGDERGYQAAFEAWVKRCRAVAPAGVRRAG